MSLRNIHSDLKALLEEAISKKDYKLVSRLINKLIASPKSFNVEDIDGIFFKDIKNIVKTKEDLENILLSTKVLFEEKQELIEFFDLLLKYGFKENAISYFEDFISQIDDLEIINGFNNLLKK